MRGEPGPACTKSHSTYVKGCRCDDCRTAHAVYVRTYRQRQTLCGYVPVEQMLPLVDWLEQRYGSLIAAERAAGFTGSSRFSHWRTGRYRYVQKASAEKVVQFVLAHKRRVPPEPWATFDTDSPRPPTPKERELARRGAQASEQRHNRMKNNLRRQRQREGVPIERIREEIAAIPSPVRPMAYREW